MIYFPNEIFFGFFFSKKVQKTKEAPYQLQSFLTMQGGHRDGINPVLDPGCNKKQEPMDIAYDSVSEISLSRTGDTVVESLRRLWIFFLATPVSWAHLEPTPQALRKRKFKKIREGTMVVLEVQRLCRNAVLDVYFPIWSFFAEEEFYLIVIPALMWNVDYVYARHLNYVVCSGLLVGNTLKDVFRLPRPQKVWRPSTAELTDSTAMRDFGYPSTHAMNALSNTLLTILYCYCPVSMFMDSGFHFADDCNGWTFISGVTVAFVWFFSITFGRLYLGAHTPTDVRGGLILGLFHGIFWWYFGNTMDQLTLFIPHVGVIALVISCVLLILSPQPRPMTPTFLQNCLLVGLFFGALVGFRMEVDRTKTIEPPAEGTARTVMLRILTGYAAVLISRQVIKALLTVMLRRLCGVDPSPMGRSTKKKDNDGCSKKKKIKVDDSDDDDAWSQFIDLDVKEPRVLRGWDLWGAALVKFVTYSFLSWLITCGVPWGFEKIGLHAKLELIHQ